MTNLVRVPGLWTSVRSDLRNSQSLRCRNNDLVLFVLSMINSVQMMGGYVAGGFPRYIAAKKLFNRTSIFDNLHKDASPFSDDFESYFAQGGDVDFFFTSEKSYEAALVMFSIDAQAIASENKFFNGMIVEKRPSMCNNATNVIVYIPNVDKRIKFQFIKKNFCDIETMLEDFDMTNSKVAIVGDEMIMHKDWYDIEKMNAIDVRKTNSAFCIGRLSKYVRRYRYKYLTQDSRNVLIQNIKTMDDIVVGSTLESSINFGYGNNKLHLKYDTESHRRNLSSIIKLFSDEDVKHIIDVYKFLPKNDQLIKECFNRLRYTNPVTYGSESEPTQPSVDIVDYADLLQV